VRHAYPIMLDLSERTIVIVGGGQVAARKARGVIDGGATDVRCVAPTFCDQMPSGVRRLSEPFAPHHLDGAHLVFAATDSPRVNEEVVAEARRRGILACRADADNDGEAGDFATPAVFRAGSVTVAVSAGGSPALAAAIRDDLAGKLRGDHARMGLAMQSLRPVIRRHVADIALRRTIFRDLTGPDAMAILLRGGEESLRAWLIGRYPQLAGAKADKP